MGQKKIWVLKRCVWTKCGSEKNLGHRKFVEPKEYFWSVKDLGSLKTFGSKKSKILGFKKNMSPKKFLVRETI